MKEILNVIVWAGFIYILFIFLRGMNETQVNKHQEKLEEAEQKQKQKNIEEDKNLDKDK
jgi:threonine/homoserine/homoserine lactone efflux protein